MIWIAPSDERKTIEDDHSDLSSGRRRGAIHRWSTTTAQIEHPLSPAMPSDMLDECEQHMRLSRPIIVVRKFSSSFA